MSFSRVSQDGGGGTLDGEVRAFRTILRSTLLPPTSLLPTNSPLSCSSGPGSSCNEPGNATTVTSVTTISSLTTIITSTISSNVISTSTQTSFSVTPIIIPPNTSIPANLAAETSLKDVATLTKTNTAAISALGAIIILLIIGISIFFFFYIRRRRHSQNRGSDGESPPLTSLTPNRPPRPQTFRPATSQSILEERPATSLSMGPRPAGYGGLALKSHPVDASRPKVAKRSSSAPNLKPAIRSPRVAPPRGIPAISIMPTVHDPDSRPGTSSSPARMPMYHAALQQEAEKERERIEKENAGRLGLPVIERKRESSDTIGSELARFAGSGNGGKRDGIVHSTRASSGIFPEGDEKGEEGNWSSRGSIGSADEDEGDKGEDEKKDDEKKDDEKKDEEKKDEDEKS